MWFDDIKNMISVEILTFARLDRKMSIDRTRFSMPEEFLDKFFRLMQIRNSVLIVRVIYG